MALKLDVDYRRRKLVILAPSSIASGDYQLPSFVQNDNTPISVSILDDNGGATPTFTRRAPSSYGLRVGLFTTAGLQLAYQATFTDDATNKVKTANLTANSANQTTALASSSEIDAYFEIEITEDGGANYETVIPFLPVRLKKEFIATAASSVPSNDTSVTVGNLAGLVEALLKSGIRLRNSTTGNERLLYLDEFDQAQVGPLPPTP